MNNAQKLMSKVDNIIAVVHRLPEQDVDRLINIKNELSDHLHSHNLDLDKIDNEIYKIVEPYCGLEDLGKWFPDKKTKDIFRTPPSVN